MTRRRTLIGLRVVVVVVALAVAIQRFMAIDATSHSASDTLRPWIIEVVLIAVVATVIVIAVETLWARRRVR